MSLYHSVLAAFFISSVALAQTPAPTAPKPPIRKLEHNGGKVGYRVKVRPGVPEANATFTLEIELAELLDKPHPTFGKRRPLDEADLQVVLVAPAADAKAKKRPASASWAEAHVAVRLADSGTYGVTFTPPTAGVYGLYLRGNSAAGVLDYATAFPVGLWPLPETTEFAAMPSPAPVLQLGDAMHGKALCEARCKKDVAAAGLQGQAPTYLASEFAAALDDRGLLTAMLAPGGSLSAMERANLVYYLRSLHLPVQDFFPNAAHVLTNSFTINQYGKERLADTAGLKLTDDESTATVFVIYKSDTPTPSPMLINYDDRVARDRLKKGNKIGYLVFLSLKGDNKGKELGIAMGLEPTYPIEKLIARDASGKRDTGFNKSLDAFVGQGKFNDKKSLAKGPTAVANKLLPTYLTAAELATMYYADEREFTAFDDEFNK